VIAPGTFEKNSSFENNKRFVTVVAHAVVTISHSTRRRGIGNDCSSPSVRRARTLPKRRSVHYGDKRMSCFVCSRSESDVAPQTAVRNVILFLIGPILAASCGSVASYPVPTRRVMHTMTRSRPETPGHASGVHDARADPIRNSVGGPPR